MSIDHTPNHGDFRVDPETQRRIEAYARAAGITPADLVRKVFEQYEATHEGEVTAFDVLSQAGLIGCLRCAPDTPTDLATNPDHMDGFGGE
jgi:hypothetical protein